jgi:SsrA-binding protein
MSKIEITNRKASYQYHLLQQFEAGIMLTGSEVKSVKAGAANMSDAYCTVEDGEVWLYNMHISEYKQSSDQKFDPKRKRKLLLNRHEIRKIERKANEKGMTLVPLRLYLSERGIIKIEISLASGKKSYDKRESIKERDIKRNMDRA